MNQVVPPVRKMMKIAESALAKNRVQEAVDVLQQVLQMNPNHAEALHKLGFIAHSAGNYMLAADNYQRALQIDPNNIDTYLLFCQLLEAQNNGTEAVRLAHRATQVLPENPDAHAALMGMLIRFNQAHLVPSYLEDILPRFPNAMDLEKFYCLSLKLNNRFAEADAAYRTLTSKFRVPASFRIQYETHLPRINLSSEEIDAGRANFKASLERFIAEKPQVSQEALLSNNPVFSLAFHNRDNKELVKLYAQMLRIVGKPAINFTAAHCKVKPVRQPDEKIRIGFVSRYMHNHSVGNCYRGAMIHLASQPEFSVMLFSIGNIVDEKIQTIHAAAIPIHSLPNNVSAAQTMIANERLDLIIYPDIGMDPMTHLLAMARLAPHQACFQGHPETTGIDTIDYVISSRSYEPPQADENYTERLLCTAGIDTVFTRPQAPKRWLTREEMTLPDDKNIYVCPMAIQKFHPDFDGVLSNILSKDPKAVLLLFNDFSQQAASDILQKRIFAKCDESRIIFFGWQPLEILLSVLKASDAILDTIYFGGGTTAQYAFGFGLPIVTMPGEYARGRVVHSYYSLMGIADAPEAKNLNEYAEMAVKLANDAEYKRGLSEQILKNNHLMWDGAPYGPKLVQLVKDIIDQNLEGYRR
ncbi:MAG: tetratricopeptide repeat protein [Rickettsiales bacterium]